MKKISKLIAGVAFITLLSSCSSAKKVTYFQDIDKQEIMAAWQNYEPTIKKDDMLSIIVSGPDKDVVMPYNLQTGGEASYYIVDINGYINFPVLGRIQAEGLTLRGLSERLTVEISRDVKNPIVHASFKNYKVTILGEVSSPGTYTMPSERNTILQAIGMAGDISYGAKRKEVLLIREVGGNYEHVRIDLRKTDIFSSPYFYLCQNDVIYVPPTSSRALAGSSQTALLSFITSGLGLVLSVIALTVKFK